MATALREYYHEARTNFPKTDRATGMPDQLPMQKAKRTASDATAEPLVGSRHVATTTETAQAEIIPMPRFRAAKKEEKVFSASKEWEGVVSFITKDAFVAELRDVSSTDDETDTIEIPLSDLPRADRHLLREGAIFRYLVGFAKNYGGTLSTKRHVYIRRGKQKQSMADDEAYWIALVEKLRG